MKGGERLFCIKAISILLAPSQSQVPNCEHSAGSQGSRGRELSCVEAILPWAQARASSTASVALPLLCGELTSAPCEILDLSDRFFVSIFKYNFVYLEFLPTQIHREANSAFWDQDNSLRKQWRMEGSTK